MHDYLDQFLNIYWLRPESAIWRASDCICMENVKIEAPSLDFGCGDGLFSFLCFGKGKLDKGYDVYFDVAGTDEFFQNADVYDTAPEKTIVLNDSSPCLFDYALDHKESLLQKAKRLKFHKGFICADANNPNWAANFDLESLSTIFSNIVYWLDDPQIVINEFAKIIRPNGKIILMLPDTNFTKSSFYYQLYAKTRDPKWEWLKYIDRGRHSSNIKTTKSYGEWAEIFENAGLQIVEHKNHLSLNLMRMWDIGLRPLFPALCKMVAKLNAADREEIKSEWIKTLKLFAYPILEMEKEAKGQDCTFHYFVLTK